MESESLLQPEERVLSTLEADGSRRWMFPRLSRGRWWQRRRVFAYALIAFFLLLPWVRLNGQPLLFLDILHRKFHVFGFTFLPTDTVLLAILVLMCFVSVFFFTAVFGRVFCGWVCPHSVYLEFVYRPIERWFTGKKGVGGPPKRNVAGWRKLAMYAVFLLISLYLANTFVSYFVGMENLIRWVFTSPPWRHPVAVGVVLVCTAWIMWDMAFWREQLCIVGCPYGRFQSVMLDRQSLIVTYDPQRGEPRGKPRRSTKGDVELPVLGDCIDCSMCVAVCPTGIDIRDGLQMECINCTQCIDACDDVMDRVDRPRGLIRYSAQAKSDGEPFRFLRPRVILYPVALLILGTLFTVVLLNKPATDLTVLRGMGRPFSVMSDGRVENQLRIKIVNRTEAPRQYAIAVHTVQGGDALPQEQVDADIIALKPSEMTTVPLRLFVDPAKYTAGRLDAVVTVTDDEGTAVNETVVLRGPARLNTKNPSDNAKGVNGTNTNEASEGKVTP